MIHVETFRAEHLAALAPAAGHAGFAALSADARCNHGHQLEAISGSAFTARREAGGKVLFCGGAGESHPHHATLWSVFDVDAGAWLGAIDRRTRWFLGGLPHRRIDTIVRADHEEGHRWVMLLGFELEGAMLADYFPDGAGACIYRLNRARLTRRAG